MQLLINFIKNNLLLSVFILIGIILTIVLVASEAFNRELILSSTSFSDGSTVITTDTNTPIVFFFPEEINAKTVRISISPKTNFNFSTQKNQTGAALTIVPNPWWDFDKRYTITIDKNLTSVGWAKLKKDIVFSFSLKFPPEDQLPPQPGPPPGLSE